MTRGRRNEMVPRRCEHCDKPLELRRYPTGRVEGSWDYAKRKYCDVACRNLGMTFTVEHSPCTACGRSMVRKQWPGGRIEGAKQFRARQTCGNVCAGRAKAHDGYCLVCGVAVPRERWASGRLKPTRGWCDKHRSPEEESNLP